MPDFERTATVGMSPDDAFRFLADPSNLPRYVARMSLAEQQGDRLHVAAEVQGRHEEGDARFQADPSRRRIEWGAQAQDQYRGWLQVSESDEGASVMIHLHVEHDRDESEIERALDETVSNIKRLVRMR